MPSEKDIVEMDEFEHDFNAWLQELEGEIEITRRSERITADDLSTVVR